MIKILLVEDSPIVRQGIATLLNAQADMQVIGEATNGAEAISWLQEKLLPDIILTDLNMPEMDGIELTQQVQALGLNTTKVIILTMHGKKCLSARHCKSALKVFCSKVPALMSYF